MFHQTDEGLDLSTPGYDFSAENPLFKAALRTRFLQAARGVAPLEDEALLNLNAAGTGVAPKPDGKPRE